MTHLPQLRPHPSQTHTQKIRTPSVSPSFLSFPFLKAGPACRLPVCSVLKSLFYYLYIYIYTFLFFCFFILFFRLFIFLLPPAVDATLPCVHIRCFYPQRRKRSTVTHPSRAVCSDARAPPPPFVVDPQSIRHSSCSQLSEKLRLAQPRLSDVSIYHHHRIIRFQVVVQKGLCRTTTHHFV